MTARDLATEVRTDFATAAAERRDALTAVGFPDSALWLRLESPEATITPHVSEPDWFSGAADRAGF